MNTAVEHCVDEKLMEGCCPPGAAPLLAMGDYTPKGEMVDIGGGVQCYVSWPAQRATCAGLTHRAKHMAALCEALSASP